MRRIADINWSIKLYAVSGVYILGLLAVGLVGGYNIYSQSATTGAALRASQNRADAAGKAQVAIVNMGLAEAQTLSAADGDEKRTAAIGAIRASSYLDESIQRLQEALAGNTKVEQLSELLKSIGPAKMQLIRAARANDDATAREKLSNMQGPMSQISSLSAELVQDAQDDLTGAVNEQKRRSKSTILVLGCLVAGGILLSLLASWFVGRLLSRPLAALETSVRSLATGDLTIEVPNFGGDEIGRTASAMGNMVADLHAMVTNIDSNGKSVTVHSESVEDAANNLQIMFGRLQEAVEKIRGDSSSVLTSTNDTISQLRDAAASAQSTSEAVARNSADVRNMADAVSSFHGRMEQILAASHELMGKVQTIGSFAQTIKDVSSQATLLALNASIQAAQAGEHGKAFNVVAGEVRKLAQNSEAATQQIASLTESIRSSIGETVTMLEQAKSESHENASRLLVVSDEAASSSAQSQQMHDRMHSMVALVDSQGSAVNGINRTVTGLFEMSENSSRQADGLHTLSGELNAAAKGLTTVVARFQLHPSENTNSRRIL
jgi:methyl-accepting chemotaxis protein